jgi:hypothetical protein
MENLYHCLEFEMGVILPQIQPVTANFMEGHKAAYPKGSKFIVMCRYWFAALDFLRGVSLYLQDQERQPSTSAGETTVVVVRSFMDLLKRSSPPRLLLPSKFLSLLLVLIGML